MIKRNCETCSAEFKTLPCRVKKGRGRFCSLSCVARKYNIVKPKKYWLGKKRRMPWFEKTQFKKGNVPWTKGKKFPELSGQNHWNWKGGISNRDMTSPEYKHWRKTIFERDNYTCQICNTRGGNLEVDHIKPWAIYVESRFDIDNGRVLCKTCHKKITKTLFRGNIFVGELENA